MKKIIGISGSPVKNSNTDKLINRILEESNLEYEFFKLSDYNVAPCRACKRCVNDNVCKVDDDFNKIAKVLRESDAVVLGSYTPYQMIDGFTKAFLERLWSMRHLNSLNEGKYAITVVSSLSDELANNVHNSIGIEFNMEKLNHIGRLTIEGSVPCLTCGVGHYCENSGARRRYGDNIEYGSQSCSKVEEQAVWNEAKEYGKKLNELLSSKVNA